ncbi:hypothetical protein GOODEAATRI_019843 [Goodea atripinnis]|uniref:Vitellogenin domain-containing protein n=1 Tax=Goodea atripinnis TaxID=208336 RepID=A0ABV0PQ31_9TELE
MTANRGFKKETFRYSCSHPPAMKVLLVLALAVALVDPVISEYSGIWPKEVFRPATKLTSALSAQFLTPVKFEYANGVIGKVQTVAFVDIKKTPLEPIKADYIHRGSLKYEFGTELLQTPIQLLRITNAEAQFIKEKVVAGELTSAEAAQAIMSSTHLVTADIEAIKLQEASRCLKASCFYFP